MKKERKERLENNIADAKKHGLKWLEIHYQAELEVLEMEK